MTCLSCFSTHCDVSLSVCLFLSVVLPLFPTRHEYWIPPSRHTTRYHYSSDQCIRSRGVLYSWRLWDPHIVLSSAYSFFDRHSAFAALLMKLWLEIRSASHSDGAPLSADIVPLPAAISTISSTSSCCVILAGSIFTLVGLYVPVFYQLPVKHNSSSIITSTRSRSRWQFL